MTETQVPKRRTRRAVKWAFGVSLALNLVFVGIFAGAALRHAGDKRGWDRKPEMSRSSGAPFVRALSQEDKRALRRALKERSAGLPDREERRLSQQQMIDVLRAENFDADAIKRLFAEQTGVAAQLSGLAQAAWLELVSGMSAQERVEVADRLEEQLMRRKFKGPKRP
ncbi:periplasmic heavy metal sensor [Sulfitobacter geojensis]|uniref:periplasmic heavy metal sensor n=1 Tax=Sulfitobacter geojensis TaxID=1342299 RepID=UPI0024937E91|nr:periplasmic heavy metal sensor [Sulfitobacter geojensis]